MPFYKRVEQLTPEDFVAHPVWEYALDMEGAEGFDETVVRPVTALPVRDAGNHVVGTMVRLANGAMLPATLSCLELASPASTRQFLAVSLWLNASWFHLARYFDVDRDVQGPAALACALGVAPGDIFPISYDVSACCLGHADVVRGVIESEPRERLTNDEIIRRAVEG